MLVVPNLNLALEKSVSRTFLELPEASGMRIETLRVYSDPPCGREVHITFADGTALSIDLSAQMSVEAKHYRTDKGAFQVLHQHRELPPGV